MSGRRRRGGGGSPPDWLRLQRKIFTRWVKQKISRKYPDIKCDDIVTDLKDGILLVRLIEVLSEKKYTGKKLKKSNSKFVCLANLSEALKFTWEAGVKVNIKPSPENLYDGAEKPILGLIWAIMLKFIKIGDDDGEQLSAKDALLMWVQNKVNGYPGVHVKDFKRKSWENGLALCAIIHKHRPKLIDWDSLDPNEPIKNFQTAIDAAYEYFGLEKYIAAEDIPKLDENSMVVYVSEYYYGIAEQRKTDLAARRIKKLIKLTKENDRLREEYNRNAMEFKERLKKVEKVLEDRSIDNTLEGAKRRLEEFYEYKTKDKNAILKNQLALEASFNNLSMRLVHNKRPPFVPPEGLSLKDVEAAMKRLEECEQERKVSLHKELNRQLELVKLAERHKIYFDKLEKWYKEKKEYLETKEEILSVGEATKQLRILDAFDKEYVSVKETSVENLYKLGKKLEEELYEHIDTIKEREKTIAEQFEELKRLGEAKRPVLDDHLAREQFKEKVRISVQEHTDKFDALLKWCEEKEAYLNIKEEIDSVPEATKQLTILESYEREKDTMHKTRMADLRKLGEEIVAQKYETEYSSWVYEKPDEVMKRVTDIEEYFEKLEKIRTEVKRPTLEDHFAREEFKDKVRNMVKEHLDKYEGLNKWCEEKEAYLNIKEEIDSVPEATKQLTILSSYEKEKDTVKNIRIMNLRKLGEDIIAQKYETEWSTWVCENPDEVMKRVTDIEEYFEKLEKIRTEVKRPTLEDHLAREEFKVKVRQMVKEHTDKYEGLHKWCESKENYLNIKEEIDTLVEASKQLTILESYEKEKETVKKSRIANLRTIGEDIVAQKYETEWSTWVYEKPDEVMKRVTDIEEYFEKLEKIRIEVKRPTLEDHVAREEFKIKVRNMVQNHTDKYEGLHKWCESKENYLNIKEEIDTLVEASKQLTILESYEKEKDTVKKSRIANLRKLGEDIVAQKYETEWSTWVYEKPDEVMKRVTDIEEYFEKLEKIRTEVKRPTLEDHLAREKFKVNVRNMVQNHVNRYEGLHKWCEEKEAYLNIKEEIDTLVEASKQLTILESYEKEKDTVKKSRITNLRTLGEDIVAQKYETEWSTWVYEHPDEVMKRVTDIEEYFEKLEKIRTEVKRPTLEDHVAREEFKIKVRNMVQSHLEMYERLEGWSKEKEEYLNIKEEIDTLVEARKQISILEDYELEKSSVKKNDIAELRTFGEDIVAQKYETEWSTWVYEHPDEVMKRVTDIEEYFEKLEKIRTEVKRPTLEDHLAREKFKVEVRNMVQEHVEMYERLDEWSKEKEEYLNIKEEIDTLVEARKQISILETYEQEKDSVKEADIAELRKFGEDIVAQKYETEWSTWVYEHPDEVMKRVTDIEEYFEKLEKIRTEVKRPTLEDHLAREKFKVKVRNMVQSHLETYEALHKWCEEKDAYLNIKEEIDTFTEASKQLTILETYEQEKDAVRESRITNLRKFGEDIVAQKYETEWSTWVYEHPDEVMKRVTDIEEYFEKLEKIRTEVKRPTLEDHVAREEFKIRVRNMVKNHSDKYEGLHKWCESKENYLNIKEEIDTFVEASKQLIILSSYEKEKDTVRRSRIAGLRKFGEDIVAQKYETEWSTWVYEHPDEVMKKVTDIEEYFEKLEKIRTEVKRPTLEDHVAREEFKIKVRNMVQNHSDRYDGLKKWCSNKENYLNIKEEIDTLVEARKQLAILETYEKEKDTVRKSRIADLRTFGEDIVAQKYETEWSTWVYEHPDEVMKKVTDIEEYFEKLEKIRTEVKRPTLEDHLAREEFKIKVRNMVQGHVEMYEQLDEWSKEKEEYLNIKEEIDTLVEARKQISILEDYELEKSSVKKNDIAELRTFGEDIVAQKYETEWSTWVYEHPDEVMKRVTDIEEYFEKLEKIRTEVKRPTLEDHVAREEFKIKVRNMVQGHVEMYERLEGWSKEKEEYLNIKEEIDTLVEARKQLTILETYEQEKDSVKEADIAELRTFGEDIVAQKYETEWSTWVYEHPDEVMKRVTDIEEYYEKLEKIRTEVKRPTLEDHLAREKFKVKVRNMVQEHAEMYERLDEWSKEKEEYLNIKEEIDSVGEALTQLAILGSHERENESVRQSRIVELRTFGEDIVAQKYETEWSTWVYEHPDEVMKRVTDIEEYYEKLEKIRTEVKRPTLEDHLAREKFKVKVRNMVQEHTEMYERLEGWSKEKEEYLNIKEEIDNVKDARAELTTLESYEREKDSLKEHDLVEFRKFGEDIIAQKYETEWSTWVYEKPDEVMKRVTDIEEYYEKLEKIRTEVKRPTLEDHLAREEFKVKVRNMVQGHADQYESLVQWVKTKDEYLDIKEEINSISEATTHLVLYATFLSELKNERETRFEELKKLKDEIYAQKYETEWSTWTYTETDVTDRVERMSELLDNLEKKAPSKKEYLDSELKKEEEKEALRLEYAHNAQEFFRWSKDQIETSEIHNFGFVLEEVEAYKEVLDKEDERILAEADQRESEIKDVKEKMDEMGVTENRYTNITLDDIAKQKEALKKALDARREAYEKELEHQRHNDQLCKEFAELADPFSAWITEQKDKITNSKEDLHAQLEFVESLLARVDEDAKKLEPIMEAQKKIDEAGIENNRHTTLTGKDVTVLWEQYIEFLEMKKKMLEEEIENEKLKGITKEQMAEIEENFKIFDKDGSGDIDRKELTACLYSLGEERSRSEIEEIMEKYGENGAIKYENFVEFMITVFGDSDTKDEIINAFRLISRGHDYVKKEWMSKIMDDEDVEYIVSTAPKLDEGYDFVAWTEDVYSR